MKCAFDIMIILSKITYYILHYLPILVSIQYLINSKRLNKDLSYAQLAHIKQELEKEIEIEREVNEALRERGQDLSSQLERADQDFDAQHHRNNRLEKDLAAARGEISQLKIDADHRDSVHQDELKTAKLSYELRFACLGKFQLYRILILIKINFSNVMFK